MKFSGENVNPDSYYDNAKATVRDSYKLWSLKEQMRQLEATYANPDQAVSDPHFYELKSVLTVAIQDVEGRMN